MHETPPSPATSRCPRISRGAAVDCRIRDAPACLPCLVLPPTSAADGGNGLLDLRRAGRVPDEEIHGAASIASGSVIAPALVGATRSATRSVTISGSPRGGGSWLGFVRVAGRGHLRLRGAYGQRDVDRGEAQSVAVGSAGRPVADGAPAEASGGAAIRLSWGLMPLPSALPGSLRLGCARRTDLPRPAAAVNGHPEGGNADRARFRLDRRGAQPAVHAAAWSKVGANNLDEWCACHDPARTRAGVGARALAPERRSER